MTDALQDTVKFRNKPRGSYSLKALFEGLIFGGAYLWREITISKSGGSGFWGTVHSSPKITIRICAA